MTTDPNSYSVPEIARLLRDLKEQLGEVREQVAALGGQFVSRVEFEAWRTAYDREIRDLKAALDAQRAATQPVKVSGWTIAGFAVAAIVGVGSLLSVALSLITYLNK